MVIGGLMPYTITDIHRKIIFNFDSNVSDLTLKTYVNDSTTSAHTYSMSNGKFIIPCSDYELSDSITKFEVVQSGSTHLWNTHEGVKILLDGVVQDVTLTESSNKAEFKLTFDKDGEYDLEAVYVGNNSVQLASTGKKHIIINQPELNESGSLQNDGKYEIIFVNARNTYYYKDGGVIKMRLLKGGVPVPNFTVQRVFASSTLGTTETDSQGYFSMQNNNWDVGKYKIGAYIQHPTTHSIIQSKYKDITIKKGDPVWEDNFTTNPNSTFVKGSFYKAHISYRGTPISNTKVDMYVKGKKTVKTTSTNGYVSYKFTSKGTYTIKIVYKGDKNHNKAEISRKITITE